jgi:tripartite-type tricarboxylate transporter receptor subunit TctC
MAASGHLQLESVNIMTTIGSSAATKMALLIGACAALGALPHGTIEAQAQPFPNRPVTLVVPYTPGGTTDNITRVVSQKLSENLGQPVVVENRPGASGNVGIASVARAKPDGYTLVIQPTTVGTFPLMSASLGYDPFADFTLVGTVAETPSIIIVKNDSKVKTMADLVALAKSKPGGINVGSGGVGGAGHLVILQLGKLNDFPVTHIAYKGTAPAVSDLLSGSIDAVSLAIGAVKGQIDGGVVRPVLVASLKRNPLTPGIPVMSEFGLKGVNGGVGYVLAVPAKTPKEVVDRLAAGLDHVLQDPDVVERMRAISFIPVRSTPAEARKVVDEQTATWAPIIKELGLKLE